MPRLIKLHNIMKSINHGFFASQPMWIKYHIFACSYLIETPKANCHAPDLNQGIPSVQEDIFSCDPNSISFFDACHVFEKTSNLNVVSATSIIGCFAKQHRHEEAVQLFSRMFASNIRPNEFTFGTILHSSTALGNLPVGKQLHALATKTSLHSNLFVGSALLDFYVKLSTIEDAQKTFIDTKHPNVVSYTTLICGYLKRGRYIDALQLFHEMPERNIVSWNAMVCGCSQIGHNEEAVIFFISMLREGFLPNQSTFPCAICAAANIAALWIGRSFHACAIKILGKLDVFVSTSLISFYAKCGSMEDSILMFNKLSKRTIASWNAVICGYAQNGGGNEAITFYKRMLSAGCKPNDVTLLGLLWACNHTGLVDVGYSYFNQARIESPSLLKPEHYACMVDLLSRSGRFTEAKSFLHNMPFDPGIGFWKALLGGCQIHSNMELGEIAARKILALDPDDVSSYVMLSNAHSAAGRWSEVSSLREEMKKKGMNRIPGCSWIEVRNKVHIFLNADKNHCENDRIYGVLRFLIEHSRENETSNLSSDLCC
ncbi:pentatricopeptide repeat-containing protein At5g42450, mitochondrial [Neltuma alba]|uniref:pentatricopeptide repeat-containing protein At5g42450, mitochondrial n=1 Tax=Neltuma alba TaxID=207710 RepID=UPI0010A4CA42|nr:pentatricopeptide repeat-containing protein At5g42450, mitochondrial [Prosopis alba]